MAGNKFRSTDVRFKDTRGAGAITVRGITLEPDEQGFVEGPPDLEKDIAPHGFYREGSQEFRDWEAAQPKPQPQEQRARTK